jgi:transcriptional regulator with XRE-family HTH domain
MEAPPSHPWRRGRLTVDLHETVPGATAARPTVFAELNTGAEVLEVAGGRVPVPGEHARLVLVALHAAHHGPRVPGPLNDLRAALERGSEDDWSSAARCAAAIGAEGAFAEGLSLAPAGAALLARLGIESRTSVAWLLARDGPPVAAGIERLASAAGVSARVAVLRDELLPTAEFMRWSSPLARRSSRGLAAAYVQRWFYLLSRGPRAFAAWRQARKRLAQ